MPYLLPLLNGLLMIGLAVLPATIVTRRFRANWGLVLIGAATFVGSQIFHIPFNALALRAPLEASGPILAAILLGLSAGLFEESARYLTYRFWARDARGWRDALALGAGHGGVEALLLGLIVIVNVLFLAGIGAGRFRGLLPADEYAAAQTQAAALAAAPWHLVLLGALERAFTLMFHLSASVLVLQVFLRKQLRWLWAAVAWHALANALALTVAQRWGPAPAEWALALVAVVSFLMILRLRDDEPTGASYAQVSETMPPTRGPIAPDLSAETLEESRFSS